MSSLEEKHMEMEHHVGEDSQEGVSTKNMPDLCKDEKIIAGTPYVEFEPQQAHLQVDNPVSGKGAIKPANVLVHMNNAIKDLPKYSCDKCPYKTKQASHLKRHQNAKHNGIRYECDQCDSTFSIKHALVRHVENKHQDKKRIFPCPQCEFVTTRMDYLRGHIENIHLKLKHECDICGQKLSSQGALHTHRKTQHEGIWWRCQEEGCDFKASDSSSLKHHTRVVHNGERYACPEEGCDFKAIHSSSLKHHTRIVHNGERYSCPQCNEHFTKISSLRRHLSKRHGAEMPKTE